MATLQLIGQLIWFFVPAGMANASPVLVGNRWSSLKTPINVRLFGSHKTWRGLLVAPLVGGIVFVLQVYITQFFELQHWYPFDIAALPWWFGPAIGSGAILGDLLKSFLKRRVGVAPGKRWFPFDQLDFIIGATLVAAFFVDFTYIMYALIFLVAPVVHILVNRFSYIIGLKDTPW